jgi:hypothetical protein
MIRAGEEVSGVLWDVLGGERFFTIAAVLRG